MRKRWEYDSDWFSAWDNPDTYLRQRGEDGWELVSLIRDEDGARTMYFKRPISRFSLHPARARI